MSSLRRTLSHMFIKDTAGDNPRNDSASRRADQTGVPLNNTPPLDNVSHNSPSNDEIPRNILAFRTITTILAQIQQEQPFKVLDVSMKDMSSQQRQELKISNAIANVAVADHDIVAVVAKRSPEELQVIACAPSSDHKNPLISMQELHPSKPWSLMQFFATKNPRRDDPKPATPISHPTIIDATIPAGLEADDDEGLKEYLEKRCKQTLATHLWILSKLLVMKDLPDDGGPARMCIEKLSHRFLLYIIATCYPKMIRRLDHRTLSKPYIESLKQVKAIPFDESHRGTPSEEQTQNDRLLLVRFLLLATSNRWLNIQIPHILEQANLAQQDKPFQLYTDDTCLEFHQLLLNLLELFRCSLKSLSESRGAEDVATEGSGKFKQDLLAVMLNGYALQRIARGSALPMHLKIITPLLSDHHRANKPASRSIPKAEMEGKWNGDKCDERDEDLEAVQPFVTMKDKPMPLWESYQDWLKLMLVHFDAVDILSRYVTGPLFNYNAISIKILVAPPVDKKLLQWQQLFTDSKLFPTTNMEPLSTSIKTNDEILKFLTTAIDSDPKQSLDLVRSTLGWWGKCDHKQTIQSIDRWKRSTLPGWSECAEKLLATLDRFDWDTRKPETLVRDVTDTIQSLCDNAKFFCSLSNLGDASFTGTLHCEACLASFLRRPTNIDGKYEDILTQINGLGRVIGVSKRCCPTCRYLLSLLTKDTTDPFLVRGSHSTVTACTLPTWLPGHIVDSMNEFFGSQLRRELIELMGRSELLRNRAQSTGSQRLSFDISDGWDQDIQLPISLATFEQATHHDLKL